ncbi:3,9-dihydroxypterocarpan 6A-monooxygenase [Linum perenne]
MNNTNTNHFLQTPSWIIPITTILTIILPLTIKLLSQTRPKTRDPPSPRALPIIGHLHLLSSSLPKSFEALSKTHGPIMKILIGPTPVYVISDAATANQILKTEDINFSSKYPLGFGLSRFDIYDDSTFVNAPYGPYWRFMKKLCVTQLFAGLQLERFTHIRAQETVKLVNKLKNFTLKDSNTFGKPCDLGKEISTLTNSVICRMVMGKRCVEDPDLPAVIRKLVGGMMEAAAKLSFAEVFGPLKRFDVLGNGRRLVDVTWEYDRVMEEIMNTYENDGEEGNNHKDVMDILLETYRDPDAELKLTRNHIKKLFLEIFFAGVDTTAATIQFAIAELINNPRILTKLRQEIDSIVGTNRILQESDVPKLPYLQAIVKETLRMHPPGPLLRRQCNTDTQINDYTIKAGTRIIVNAYAIMREKDTWNDPDVFDPERFSEMGYKGNECRFLAFGGGRRACPGMNHGLIVTHTTIGGLVQCFDWKLKGADMVDIKLVTGYSGAMASPLVCYPIPRCDFTGIM